MAQSFALVLFDQHGETSVIQTHKLQPQTAVKVAGRTFLQTMRNKYLIEVIDLADSSSALKISEKKFLKTHRARAIETAQKRGAKGGYLDIWPEDEENTMNHKKRQRVTASTDRRPLAVTQSRAKPVPKSTKLKKSTPNQFPRTIKGSKGRTLSVLYEGSGDYTDQQAEPKRAPLHLAELTADEADIVKMQIDSSTRNTISKGVQTDTVVIVASDAEAEEWFQWKKQKLQSSLPATQPSPPQAIQQSPLPAIQPSPPPAIQPLSPPPAIQPLSPPAVQPSPPPAIQPLSPPPAIQPLSPPAFQPSPPPAIQPLSPPAFQPSPPPAIQPLSPPAFQPSPPPAFQPSPPPAIHLLSPPAIHLSSPPAIQPSSPPTIQPSSPPAIQPSSPPAIQPFSPPPAIQPLSPPAIQLTPPIWYPLSPEIILSSPRPPTPPLIKMPSPQVKAVCPLSPLSAPDDMKYSKIDEKLDKILAILQAKPRQSVNFLDDRLNIEEPTDIPEPGQTTITQFYLATPDADQPTSTILTLPPKPAVLQPTLREPVKAARTLQPCFPGNIFEVTSHIEATRLPIDSELRVPLQKVWEVHSKANSVGNFAWRLAKDLYTRESLVNKNYTGKKGKQALSPRRRHAIEHAIIDSYGPNQDYLKEGVLAINAGIRNGERLVKK